MSVLDRRPPEPDAVLRYAERPDALIDVFLPHPSRVHHGTLVDPHSPRPTRTRLVVHLHGGFWREAYDRTHARTLAAALAADGAVVALPEYRRVGGGGGWPTTGEDVRDAVAALPDLLRTIDVRPTDVTISGHSAGGHLALWLAAQPAPHEVVVERVVALAPVGDLHDAVATRMGDGAALDLLRITRPDDVPDDADPAVLLGRHRPAYPVTVLHGTADDVVPLANSRGLVDRHPWITLDAMDRTGHFDVIDPLSAAYPSVRSAILDQTTD